MANPDPGRNALKHGAYSEELVTTEARELVPEIFELHPHLDRRDSPAVARYAIALARCERIYSWLAGQADPVFADLDAGQVHAVFGRLERWERQASDCERELAISPRERAKLGIVPAPQVPSEDERRLNESIEKLMEELSNG